MTAIAKDLLYPGIYHLPDGRVFKCKPEEIPHYTRRMRDMLAARVPIPVRWEHSKTGDSTELSAADKAKYTVGHALDAATTDGFLETKMEIKDPEDVRRLPKVRFVSPTIKWDVVDSTGRVWPGPSITEIALTPIPIQTQQKEFALSQAGSGDMVTKPNMTDPIHLSLAGYEPVKLSGGATMPDNFPPAADDNNKTPPADPPAEETELSDEDKKLQEDAEGLAAQLKTALTTLADHGLILGGDTPADFKQFLDRLITACKTKKAAESPGDVDSNGNAVTEPTEVDAPVMMSAAKGTGKLIHENYRLKIDGLWKMKRITKSMRDQLAAELGEMKAVRLSAAGGDVVPGSLHYTIEAYERLPEGFTAFTREVNLSAATEIPEPENARAKDEVDRERQQKAGSAMAAMVK